MDPVDFQNYVLEWAALKGRKDLPWQQPVSPYRVWVSEVMLQQTQVAAVIPYFQKFIRQFPDVQSLAIAPLDQVLTLWSGLGYYARARHLHESAKVIVAGNTFPNTLPALMALPGVGRSTAGAILSIAFEQSAPILDGNVKRVLSRCFGVSGWPGNTTVLKELWQLSALYTPEKKVAAYTQAMMDLGATICKRQQPLCLQCPLHSGCIAFVEDRVSLLPTAKPQVKLPIKEKIFLMLVNDWGEVFLTKRPLKGIWAGLWCLPEFSDLEGALNWCDSYLHIEPLYQLQQVRRHTFSHYHLDYQVVFMKTEIREIVLDNSACYCPATNFELGLPAPMKHLLNQL
ncbi:MAG TPA: A/G-specific adenine glycosylase [Methylococcaceae bacterium]|jgi:A/G-specific adenine glycosylase|nr:A/G-specific adenine glycosylase [Methylococcaceae bacterium]HIN68196.1 A/G-specific adenine glycosylase [Methylococcales bacterium]HIA44397.1 A/G-specific adenine glycosylase [Methylococcaceae bacterium]HIB62413.1 A/G-specific adenine glycosylase [Methylococcaceae bacterium]HIO12544.1 A/G-specific adenine glycosylase [Methylococcales bacterium]